MYDAAGNPLAGADRKRIRSPTAISTGRRSKAENTAGTVRLGWLTANVDIDALLRAEQENVNAKLLANPRVLVLNDETATIKIVSEIPYQELQESSLGGSIGIDRLPRGRRGAGSDGPSGRPATR